MAVNEDRLLDGTRVPAIAERKEPGATILEGDLLEAALDGLMVSTRKDARHTKRP